MRKRQKQFVRLLALILAALLALSAVAAIFLASAHAQGEGTETADR